MQIDLTNTLNLALGEVCVNVGNNKRNMFNVMEKDGMQPVRSQVIWKMVEFMI